MLPKITNTGYHYLVEALNEKGIKFSKILLGDGAKPDNYKVVTELVSKKMEVGIEEFEVDETTGYVSLSGIISNADLEEQFNWSEVAICVEDPDTGDTDKIYAYGHCELDNPPSTPIYIPKQGTQVYEIIYQYRIYVGDVNDISAIISEATVYARKSDFEAHLADESNPHSVTAEQVGLGNVPNVTTNEQTPTYELAEEFEELESGEELTTAFGKIARAVKNLIAHIGNSTLHVTTAEKNAWYAKAESRHYHNTSAITAGVLEVIRGGTGNSTVDTVPTEDSTKMVTSHGIKLALDEKADAEHEHNASNIVEGYFGGLVRANPISTRSLASAQIRDILVSNVDLTEDVSDLEMGSIYIYYED